MERDLYIKVKCSEAEKRRFQEKAAHEGVTVSDLVRRKVFGDSAEEIVDPFEGQEGLFAGVGLGD